MNPEKEARLTKIVGIASALCLLLLLAGVTYFFIANQQTEQIVQIESVSIEEPIDYRETNSSDKELLYAAAELARSIEYGDPINLGEPVEGSPGVYKVNVYEREEGGVYKVDAYGNIQSTGVDVEPEDVGFTIKK